MEEEQTTQWPKEKVQKAKQRSTKHTYKTKDRVTRTPMTKNRGWTQVLRKGRQSLLHYWHLSCYSSYKPGSKSWMRKGLESVYDKWNISVVICIIKLVFVAHLKCTVISLGEHNKVSNSSDTFYCLLCNDRLPMFTNSFFFWRSIARTGAGWFITWSFRTWSIHTRWFRIESIRSSGNVALMVFFCDDRATGLHKFVNFVILTPTEIVTFGY